LRTSVSNHWSRKSAELIVMSLDEGVALVGREFAETLKEEVKLLEVFGIERGGICGTMESMGFTKRHMGGHHLREFAVGSGVHAGVAANVADGFGVVVDAPEVAPLSMGENVPSSGRISSRAREIEFAE